MTDLTIFKQKISGDTRDWVSPLPVATADILDTVSNGFTLNETLAKCETLSAK